MNAIVRNERWFTSKVEKYIYRLDPMFGETAIGKGNFTGFIWKYKNKEDAKVRV